MTRSLRPGCEPWRRTGGRDGSRGGETPNLPDLLSPLVGVPISETFALLLVLHVLAGLTCVATGLVAIGQLEASWAD